MAEAAESLGLMSLIFGAGFSPQTPKTLGETGLPDTFLDALICKTLLIAGTASGRALADDIAVPFGIMEDRFRDLRMRQLLSHKTSAALNDYVYVLSQQGKDFAQHCSEANAYIGSAPVPLADYISSVDAQSITTEVPKQAQLEHAFKDISVNPKLFMQLGPAINSGAGLFLYGAPGNGKTTLAERVTLCFGQEIWIPRALIADGQVVKLFDPAYHEEVHSGTKTLLKEDHDRRWAKIRRPTVVAGGELTLDNLEIRHDPRTNVSEAPLQMKSNCGSLLIDDFGRQRVDPQQLLNRWIVPLEKRYDFLTLSTGKKIQVPFDQLIIFSTNLEPRDLVDEAFLRRIPYKINVPDPDEAEFSRLFEQAAAAIGCPYEPAAVEHLLARHYRPIHRPMRRCHPRDLLLQVYNYCKYLDRPMEMEDRHLDAAVENYFTVVN